MSFASWRLSVPWSDEQIAAALEQEAEGVQAANSFLATRYRLWAGRVRLGHLSAKYLSVALGRLVTACGICGKKALYRAANEGRCSTHRMVPAEARQKRVDRLNNSSADFSRERLESDYRALRHRAAEGTAKFSNPGKGRG